MKTILLGGPHDGQIVDVRKTQSTWMRDGHRYWRLMMEGTSVFASTDVLLHEVHPLIVQKLVELAELKQQVAGALGDTESTELNPNEAKQVQLNKQDGKNYA